MIITKIKISPSGYAIAQPRMLQVTDSQNVKYSQ